MMSIRNVPIPAPIPATWLALFLVASTGYTLGCRAGELRLRPVEYKTARISPNGRIYELRKQQGLVWDERLGSEVVLELAQVPAGSFLMGVRQELEPFGLGATAAEQPARWLTMPAFLIGRTEVTQAQWRQVALLPEVKRHLPLSPSVLKGDDLPVTNIGWEEAVEFCDRLSLATGRHYRLPSEAEWEYAARGGVERRTPFGMGLSPRAANCNYTMDGEVQPIQTAAESMGPVGREPMLVDFERLANGFGLLDTIGNVDEWVLDAWHDRFVAAPEDARPWKLASSTGFGVARGGRFSDQVKNALGVYRCTTRQRTRAQVDRADGGRGFRVVMALEPPRWKTPPPTRGEKNGALLETGEPVRVVGTNDSHDAWLLPVQSIEGRGAYSLHVCNEGEPAGLLVYDPQGKLVWADPEARRALSQDPLTVEETGDVQVRGQAPDCPTSNQGVSAARTVLLNPHQAGHWRVQLVWSSPLSEQSRHDYWIHWSYAP